MVTCPECGTENELGYRYCRACVSELSGAVASADHEITFDIGGGRATLRSPSGLKPRAHLRGTNVTS